AGLQFDTASDTEWYALPSSAPARRRVALARVPGSWYVYYDGHFVGAVNDSVTDGPATMQIAVYGDARFGGLAVDGFESPELADASEATWVTATHSYTHT